MEGMVVDDDLKKREILIKVEGVDIKLGDEADGKENEIKIYADSKDILLLQL